MKKFLKVALGAVISIILLLVIIPFFIPAETYKNLLIAQVKKMTGRELVIAGDASLKLFPNVALDVSDVTLSNPAGFSDKELTRIGKLSVHVALQPLFDKRLEMKGATIEDAVLALEEREDGTKSWELMPAVKGVEAEAANEPATPTQKSAGKDLSNIILGTINIKNSSVTYRKPGAKAVELSNINLAVDSSGFASALKADFSAKFKGEDVSVNATIGNPEDFLNAKATSLDIAAKLPSASINFKGDGAMGKSIAAMGDLAADISDLPKLTAWATGKPGAAAPKSISIKGKLAAKENSYTLSGASLGVDGVQATGDIGATLGGAVPAIKGTLAFGALDIDAITKKPAAASSDTAASAESASASAGSGWSTAPIDLSGLRAVNADLGLSAQNVSTGKVKLGQTSAKIKLAGGDLRINDISTVLYDGTAKGSLRVDGSGKSANIGANMQIASVQIEPLMKALSGKSRLAGTANLSFNLNGSGNSQRAIVSSLGGNGSMNVLDGAILGINLGQFLRDAKKGFLFDSPSERTDFAELSGTFTVASGVLSNNDLSMKAPLLRLSGVGTTNLPNKTIDYRLTPKIAATTKGQGGKDDKAGISIPLMISGPWSNPSITPDLAGMVQEGLKDPEAMKQNIKNIGEGLKDFNSKDDLKRAILGGGKKEAPAPAPAKQDPVDSIKGLIKGF